MIIALGEHNCGYFCNDDKLAQQLDRASEASGDKAWRLPLDPKYVEDIKGVAPLCTERLLA